MRCPVRYLSRKRALNISRVYLYYRSGQRDVHALFVAMCSDGPFVRESRVLYSVCLQCCGVLQMLLDMIKILKDASSDPDVHAVLLTAVRDGRREKRNVFASRPSLPPLVSYLIHVESSHS